MGRLGHHVVSQLLGASQDLNPALAITYPYRLLPLMLPFEAAGGRGKSFVKSAKF